MKRSAKMLTVAAVLAASVAVPATPAVAAGTGWWARSGYAVTNTGFNPNETRVTVSTVANLKLKYTSTPARTGQRAPVVADGLVYTPDDRGITATDEASGAQQWRFEPDLEGFSPPVLLVHTAGQIILTVNDSPAMPGLDSTQIFVLDAATGAVVRDFNDEGVTTQMLVDKGVVVVSGESRYSSDARAYSLADGELLWRHNRYMRQPVSANGRVLLSGTGLGAGPPTSIIVDIVTGGIVHTSLAWREYRPLAADESGTKFYVAWGHSLQVLDATTGALTWLASNLSPKYVVLSPSRLYVTSFGGTVFALNRSTGAQFWSRSIPGSEHQRAIIAGGVLYVTAQGDRVHTLNPVDGAPLNAPAFAGAVDQLVVTYGRAYATDGAQLTAYGL